MQILNFSVIILSLILALVSIVLFVIMTLKSWMWSPVFLISLPALYLALTKTPLRTYLHQAIDVYSKFFVKAVYDLICWFFPVPELTCLNNGYVTLTGDGKLPIEMKPEFEFQRLLFQLYHYVATSCLEVKSLEGQNVLEVSSGRGGGVDYMTKALNAASCVGVEYSPNQVEFSKKRFQDNPKVEFYQGDAEHIAENPGVKGREFDLVVNIESSNHYFNFREFVKGVDKILKPGGIFAYYDYMENEIFDKYENELETFNMKIMKKEDLTKNCMRSMAMDDERRRGLMLKYCPKLLLPIVKHISGTPDGRTHTHLVQNSFSARYYILKKLN